MTKGQHLQNAQRLAPGDTISPRELIAIRSEPVFLPAPGVLTHLQFRRYAGCPICNVHLQSFSRRYDEISAAGIREVVVFHSSVKNMLPHQDALPFAAIADPGKELYRAFVVGKAIRPVRHPPAA